MRRTWMALALCAGLTACGGTEEASQLAASLEDGTDTKGDPGPSDPGDPGDPNPGDKGDPGDHKDPGDCGGDPAPVPTCADKGLACSSIVDKENLCADGLEPIWELACGDNEVCCGVPIVEEPGDPNPDPGK